VAQQAVQHYGWLTPREMLDGLGMAETTPGPLIMVLQFVGFMAAYRNPGTHSARGNHGRIAGNLGHVHPLLPLDICWCALNRKAAQRRSAECGALSSHRGCCRRDLELGPLVRDPYDLWCHGAGQGLGIGL